MRSFLLSVILVVSFGLTAGCQSPPPPGSRRAMRDRHLNWVIGRIAAREARSPQNAEQSARLLGECIAGDPDSALRTARRVLELD